MRLLPSFVVNCFQRPPAAGEAAKFRVVFVLGGPGSGKGTMCGRIVEKYGWVHLSAGDLLRAERKDPSSKDGELINEYIREGKIVPVEITLTLLKRAMEGSGKRDFLVDGFPRNLDNLDGWLGSMTECAEVVNVLYLETTEQVMQDRILKRAAETLAAGGATRADDNVEAIQKRFKTYLESTLPIIDRFRQQGILFTVDSTPDPDRVFANLSQLFDSL
mmetsp:Transcript_14323/g.45166  ORF Transcript_14323/g.45166 Transcript_14323/m.45166 type:complete len:218 (-) Transcript_14323:230-883(-)